MLDNVIRLVNDNETILITSLGDDFLKIIKRIDKFKVGVTIYLLKCQLEEKIKCELREAPLDNVDIIFTNISSLPCVIKKIDKLFCGSQIVYSNSTVLSSSGSSLIASLAYKFRKPFYMISMICSFTQKTQLDSLCINQSKITQY